MRFHNPNKLFDSASLPEVRRLGSLGVSFVLHTVLLFMTLMVPLQQLERVQPIEVEQAPGRSLASVTLVEPPPDLIAPEPAPDARRLPPQETPQKLKSPIRYRVRELEFEPPAAEPIKAPVRKLAVEASGRAPLPPIEPPSVENLEPPVRTGLLPEAKLEAVEPGPRRLTVRRGRFSAAEARQAAEPPDETVKVAGFGISALTNPRQNSDRRRVADADFSQIEVEFSHEGRSPGRVADASRFESAQVEPPVPVDASPVRKGGFGEIVAQQPLEPPAEPKQQRDPFEGVRILEKLRPAYTAEARRLRVEGDVLLEVLFKASGTVEILRLIERLGYGLDANAAEAARKLRFEPARRGGKPVDSRAIVTISFQLAY